MSAHLDRRTVILAAPESGLLIPMLSPHRVMAGHLFGTLRMAEKKLAIRMVMGWRSPRNDQMSNYSSLETCSSANAREPLQVQREQLCQALLRQIFRRK